MSTMNNFVRGSCLCGGVRFEVRPPFIRANHCHCSRCRKHSGAAVCTQARVWREQFELLAGPENCEVAFDCILGHIACCCSVSPCVTKPGNVDWGNGQPTRRCKYQRPLTVLRTLSNVVLKRCGDSSIG